MATARKSTTTKKGSSKAKSVASRSASRAKSVSKPASRSRSSSSRAGSRKASAASYQSFRLTRDSKDFYSWKPDIQTLYWVILAVPVIGLVLWVANINLQVQEIYSQIEVDSANQSVKQNLQKIQNQQNAE